jgi:hypothetical protein
MFTTILEETQPCFVECGTALVKEYPMALYQDDKNVYHVVGPKESIISSWKFIARFQNKHNATLYGRYLTRQKEPKWFVYFDNDKNEYITMAQNDLHFINPRWKLVRPFFTVEEADKYTKDCNFYCRINNESEEVKWNANRAEAAENEDENDGTISSFEEAYKLVKEGKTVLGKPKDGKVWVNLSENLKKLMNDWEFYLDDEECCLEVKLSSKMKLDDIMQTISKMANVKEVKIV